MLRKRSAIYSTDRDIQRNVESYLATGMVHQVEVLGGSEGCCPTCDADAGKRYPIPSRLPVPHHPGCPCDVIPILDDP